MIAAGREPANNGHPEQYQREDGYSRESSSPTGPKLPRIFVRLAGEIDIETHCLKNRSLKIEPAGTKAPDVIIVKLGLGNQGSHHPRHSPTGHRTPGAESQLRGTYQFRDFSSGLRSQRGRCVSRVSQTRDKYLFDVQVIGVLEKYHGGINFFG